MTVSIVYKTIFFADGTSGNAAFAFDGTNYYPVSMQVDNTGALVSDASGLPVAIVGTVPVSLTGTVAVTGTFWQATQPISAANLPLPAGAATAAIQTSILTALGSPLQAGGTVSVSGVVATDGQAEAPTGGAVPASAEYIGYSNGGVLTGVSTAAPLPVAATTLPLPTGAATAANQASLLTALGSPAQDATVAAVTTALGSPAQDATVAAVTMSLGTDGTTPPALPGGATGVRGWLRYIGSLLNGTLAVSAASLPLPTGASQDGTDGTGIVQPTGGAGIRGWLSGIFQKLSGLLSVNITSLSFPASTSNSTTAQLAAGASFTGIIETVQNLQAAQVEVVSDQPFQVVVNQYIDAGGTKLSSSDVFLETTAPYQFNQNISLPGNFFNVVVTNLGAATTALAVDTTYGIMATGPRTVTVLGNNRAALNEVGGTPITTGQTKGASSLPVVLASDQPSVVVTDRALTDSVEGGFPLTARLVGGPDGGFAGVDLFEQIIDEGTGVAASVRVVNPGYMDANGALIASDAPGVQYFSGVVGSVFVLNAAGYKSIAVAMSAAVGTLTASTDGVVFSQTFATALAGGNGASTLSANTNYLIPGSPQFIKITLTTAGTFAAQRRNVDVPLVIGWQYAGVAGVPAVGGKDATGVAPTANPMVVGGVDPTTGLTRRVQTDPNGNVLLGALLQQGWTPGVYNVNYTSYTTAQASLTAALSAVNPLLVGNIDTYGAVRIPLLARSGVTIVAAESSSARPAIDDVLVQLSLQFRAQLYLLSEILRGTTGEIVDPDVLIAEYLAGGPGTNLIVN